MNLATARHEGGRLRLGRRAESTDALRTAVTELTQAIDDGADYLPGDDVLAAEKVLKKAAERLTLSGRHTVVALAGATGSGKSSLFNALVGQEVSRAGHLRPTTSRTSAATWGTEPAAELLDWLRVQERHRVAPGGGPARTPARAPAVGVGSAEGLVLLDLPDIDSTRASHRAEADRILAMTDVFVWVTDPQKYADALLHDDYLAPARHHGAVTLVVLNQADRMTREEAQACRADLHRLLALDGLPQADVMLCSALTGEGVPELFTALTGAVAAAEAMRARLLGDVRRSAQTLRAHVGDTEPSVGDEVGADLVDALADSAGAPIVLASVEAEHRRRALAATGWPFTRWARRLRPDPLKRLRLDARKDTTGEVTAFPDELEALVKRSSLPQATPSARAAVDLVTRRLGSSASQGLPSTWAEAVQDAARPSNAQLADALDQAIVGTSLHVRRPVWWSLLGLLQWLLALGAVVGLGWLLALATLAWFQLPVPPVPTLGYVPVPTLLAVVGPLGGLLLAGWSRVFARMGARRRSRTIALRLRERISAVAQTQLLQPVRTILARHRTTRQHLDAAIDL
ncbi:MAG: 50S ribosome-binding GTPase [Micrococcales bacterium]|nr:50S ribosome-binding GTPase [Micrococcales bacterium]